MRGSGPNRKHAFKDALTHTGCPDPRIDLVCITSSVLANSFNFKRHRRCLSHLLESLCLTRVGTDAERIRSSISKLTSNSVDELEKLISKLQELREFLKSETSHVQGEIGSV